MRGAVSPRKNYCPFLRKLIALFPEKMIALFSENSPPLSAVHAKTFKLVDTFPLKNTEKLLTFLNLLSQFPYPTYVSGTPCIPPGNQLSNSSNCCPKLSIFICYLWPRPPPMCRNCPLLP